MSKNKRNQNNKIKLNNVITIYNNKKDKEEQPTPDEQEPTPEMTPEENATQKLQQVEQINRVATSQLNNPINQRYNQIADMQRNDQRDNIAVKLEERLKGVISQMDNPRFMQNQELVNQQREQDIANSNERIPLTHEIGTDPIEAEEEIQQNVNPDVLSSSTSTSTKIPFNLQPIQMNDIGKMSSQFEVSKKPLFRLNEPWNGLQIGLSNKNSIYFYRNGIWNPRKSLDKRHQDEVLKYVNDNNFSYPAIQEADED